MTEMLARMAGPGATPREDQRAAVAALVEGRQRVLCVQATGWGKSFVYWAATRALRDTGAGPTIVVSPLLALMRDQVAAAGRAGLTAGTVHSANRDEWPTVMAAWRAGSLDVVLISPERLASLEETGELAELLAACGLLVIDEAHAVSDWGHEFRPDYRRLAGALLALAADTPVLATTATANDRVVADVAAQLGSASVVLRGSLARASLRLGVTAPMAPVARYAWVESALGAVAGSGIVYVLTTKEAERLAGYLAGRGLQVAAYHGGLEPDARAAIEDALRANELKAVIATSALGMGYDKGDLAFCFHLGVPPSPVAYYQQIGRAGRQLDDAVVVAVPSAGDERLWEWYRTAAVPDRGELERVLGYLEAEGPASTVAIEAGTGVRRSRVEALVKLLAVDGAVARQAGTWTATGRGYTWDQAHWDALGALRLAEAATMRTYLAEGRCLLALLQGALDDPAPTPCGRCSACTGSPVLDVTVTDEQLAAVRTALRGVDVVLEPRKRWPSGVARRGTIAALAEGRALGFADDPAWAGELAAFAAGTLDEQLAAGAVAALARWKQHWPARPVAICVLGDTDPATDRAVRALAAHLGAVGRLPVCEPVHQHGPGPEPGAAAAATVTAWEQALSCTSELVPAGPVLLVAASTRSGWRLTVAGALLREAGASAVLPFVAHQLA